MPGRGRLLLLEVVLVAVAASSAYAGYDAAGGTPPSISRRSFPKGFIFGTSSSAYQVGGEVH
jgi:hypothetical protein